MIYKFGAVCERGAQSMRTGSVSPNETIEVYARRNPG
jgi:hypothetical protein